MRIAVGTDAPAIPHGRNASELVTLASRGLNPLDVLRAATVTAAELLDVADRGRLAPGLLADIVGVPGDPLQDIAVTQDVRFVMKGGKVFVPAQLPARHGGAACARMKTMISRSAGRHELQRQEV